MVGDGKFKDYNHTEEGFVSFVFMDQQCLVVIAKRVEGGQALLDRAECKKERDTSVDIPVASKSFVDLKTSEDWSCYIHKYCSHQQHC
jgi:hypothetical protein